MKTQFSYRNEDWVFLLSSVTSIIKLTCTLLAEKKHYDCFSNAEFTFLSPVMIHLHISNVVCINLYGSSYGKKRFYADFYHQQP